MTETKTYIEWTSTIEDALHAGVIVVVYEKKDGAERRIKCTLDNMTIPCDKMPKGVRNYDHTNVRRVYDLDKNQWRSINTDRVIMWEVAD